MLIFTRCFACFVLTNQNQGNKAEPANQNAGKKVSSSSQRDAKIQQQSRGVNLNMWHFKCVFCYFYCLSFPLYLNCVSFCSSISLSNDPSFTYCPCHPSLSNKSQIFTVAPSIQLYPPHLLSFQAI